MNRILKIVGGPLKGAEIALVAGTKVKVGSGDDCDVLVSDPTLEKFAFELDVAEDEVTITTPDGAAKTMLDYEAKEFGSSAFAVGAAEGKWQEIVWPEKRNEELRVKSEEVAGEVPPKADPLKEGEKDVRRETEDTKGGEKKPSCVSRLVSLVLVVAAIVLVLIAILCLRCCRNCRETRCETVISRVTLSDVAARYGLTVTETNGQFVVRGDLKSRADRLAATAAAYQAQPGVEVDLSDDESLLEAAEALIGMVAGDSLKVIGATNRVVALRGKVGSIEELRRIIWAFDRDVPCATKVDCGRVICGSMPAPKTIVAVGDVKPVASGTPQTTAVPLAVELPAKPARGGRKAVTRLPLCGILTVPYPCIILKNGNRVSEGGEFGGYVVEKIRTDALTLRDGARTFEWKP